MTNSQVYIKIPFRNFQIIQGNQAALKVIIVVFKSYLLVPGEQNMIKIRYLI